MLERNMVKKFKIFMYFFVEIFFFTNAGLMHLQSLATKSVFQSTVSESDDFFLAGKTAQEKINILQSEYEAAEQRVKEKEKEIEELNDLINGSLSTLNNQLKNDQVSLSIDGVDEDSLENRITFTKKFVKKAIDFSYQDTLKRSISFKEFESFFEKGNQSSRDINLERDFAENDNMSFDPKGLSLVATERSIDLSRELFSDRQMKRSRSAKNEDQKLNSDFGKKLLKITGKRKSLSEKFNNLINGREGLPNLSNSFYPKLDSSSLGKDLNSFLNLESIQSVDQARDIIELRSRNPFLQRIENYDDFFLEQIGLRYDRKQASIEIANEATFKKYAGTQREVVLTLLGDRFESLMTFGLEKRVDAMMSFLATSSLGRFFSDGKESPSNAYQSYINGKKIDTFLKTFSWNKSLSKSDIESTLKLIKQKNKLLIQKEDLENKEKGLYQELLALRERESSEDNSLLGGKGSSEEEKSLLDLSSDTSENKESSFSFLEKKNKLIRTIMGGAIFALIALGITFLVIPNLFLGSFVFFALAWTLLLILFSFPKELSPSKITKKEIVFFILYTGLGSLGTISLMFLAIFSATGTTAPIALSVFLYSALLLDIISFGIFISKVFYDSFQKKKTKDLVEKSLPKVARLSFIIFAILKYIAISIYCAASLHLYIPFFVIFPVLLLVIFTFIYKYAISKDQREIFKNKNDFTKMIDFFINSDLIIFLLGFFMVSVGAVLFFMPGVNPLPSIVQQSGAFLFIFGLVLTSLASIYFIIKKGLSPKSFFHFLYKKNKLSEANQFLSLKDWEDNADGQESPTSFEKHSKDLVVFKKKVLQDGSTVYYPVKKGRFKRHFFSKEKRFFTGRRNGFIVEFKKVSYKELEDVPKRFSFLDNSFLKTIFHEKGQDEVTIPVMTQQGDRVRLVNFKVSLALLFLMFIVVTVIFVAIFSSPEVNESLVSFGEQLELVMSDSPTSSFPADSIDPSASSWNTSGDLSFIDEVTQNGNFDISQGELSYSLIGVGGSYASLYTVVVFSGLGGLFLLFTFLSVFFLRNYIFQRKYKVNDDDKKEVEKYLDKPEAYKEAVRYFKTLRKIAIIQKIGSISLSLLVLVVAILAFADVAGGFLLFFISVGLLFIYEMCLFASRVYSKFKPEYIYYRDSSGYIEKIKLEEKHLTHVILDLVFPVAMFLILIPLFILSPIASPLTFKLIIGFASIVSLVWIPVRSVLTFRRNLRKENALNVDKENAQKNHPKNYSLYKQSLLDQEYGNLDYHKKELEKFFTSSFERDDVRAFYAYIANVSLIVQKEKSRINSFSDFLAKASSDDKIYRDYSYIDALIEIEKRCGDKKPSKNDLKYLIATLTKKRLDERLQQMKNKSILPKAEPALRFFIEKIKNLVDIDAEGLIRLMRESFYTETIKNFKAFLKEYQGLVDSLDIEIKDSGENFNELIVSLEKMIEGKEVLLSEGVSRDLFYETLRQLKNELKQANRFLSTTKDFINVKDVWNAFYDSIDTFSRNSTGLKSLAEEDYKKKMSGYLVREYKDDNKKFVKDLEDLKKRGYLNDEGVKAFQAILTDEWERFAFLEKMAKLYYLYVNVDDIIWMQFIDEHIHPIMGFEEKVNFTGFINVLSKDTIVGQTWIDFLLSKSDFNSNKGGDSKDPKRPSGERSSEVNRRRASGERSSAVNRRRTSGERSSEVNRRRSSGERSEAVRSRHKMHDQTLSNSRDYSRRRYTDPLLLIKGSNREQLTSLADKKKAAIERFGFLSESGIDQREEVGTLEWENGGIFAFRSKDDVIDSGLLGKVFQEVNKGLYASSEKEELLLKMRYEKMPKNIQARLESLMSRDSVEEEHVFGSLVFDNLKKNYPKGIKIFRSKEFSNAATFQKRDGVFEIYLNDTLFNGLESENIQFLIKKVILHELLEIAFVEHLNVLSEGLGSEMLESMRDWQSGDNKEAFDLKVEFEAAVDALALRLLREDERIGLQEAYNQLVDLDLLEEMITALSADKEHSMQRPEKMIDLINRISELKGEQRDFSQKTDDFARTWMAVSLSA
ncbi:hypothetical protein AB834_03345 [PVC group bacterium (ex Bugula neritina AB1)]|nr:hypothetical protein AB834_03345 [PVC group bacterium (ex Bugula neritina AB1)]